MGETDRPVGPDNSELDVVRLFAAQRGLHTLFHSINIIGMHTINSRLKGQVTRSALQAADAIMLVRPLDRIVANVPAPAPELRARRLRSRRAGVLLHVSELRPAAGPVKVGKSSTRLSIAH